MSPAWFSTATFNPLSTIRDFTLRNTFTVFSMWPSIPGSLLRSAACPRKHRTIFEPTSTAASAARVNCSSAVPCLGSNNDDDRANRPHPQLDLDLALLGVGANLLQVLRLQAADEPQFAEMHHLNPVLRAEIQVLKRSPTLGANAEEVESEFDVGGGGSALRLDKRGSPSGEKRASIHGRYCTVLRPA